MQSLVFSLVADAPQHINAPEGRPGDRVPDDLQAYDVGTWRESHLVKSPASWHKRRFCNRDQSEPQLGGFPKLLPLKVDPSPYPGSTRSWCRAVPLGVCWEL
jgi:hypothetical protein